MYLERVLPREALLTVVAAKRLDGQVDALMALEVVVAVEGLGALVALEGPLRLRRGPARVVDVQVVRVVRRQARVVVVVAGEARHAAHHGHGCARVVHVAQHRAGDRAVRGVRDHGRDPVGARGAGVL